MQELPTDKNDVPHFLPGQNPFIGEFGARHAMPEGGVRGGVETPAGVAARGQARGTASERERRFPARASAVEAGRW